MGGVRVPKIHLVLLTLASPVGHRETMSPTRGQKIRVFDEAKRELGEGTFQTLSVVKLPSLVAYECTEHTILAKFPHWLQIAGERVLIKSLADTDAR